MSDNDADLDNDYVNQLTLNFLISKSQLHKLNKLKQKDIVPIYDKKRVHKLFNKLLNDENPDDLLDDVKMSFDAFIEKSIYYLEIHDKNETIQNERNGNQITDVIDDDNDDANDDDDDVNDDVNDDDDDDDENDDDANDDVVEEYRPVITQKSKYSKQNNASNGVEDIQKLPLDWFNTTRQNYKINQIISRKKEIIVDNSLSKKTR
jgi:hypothetical protein